MNLTEKVSKSLVWILSSNISIQITQQITSIILARILSPNEFGLMAMIIVFSGVINLINDFGISSALIHHQGITKGQYSSTFFLNFFISLFLGLVFILLSPTIASFYNQETLVELCYYLSITFVFNAVPIVQIARIKQRLEFKKVSIIEFVSVFIAGLISIYMALNGYGIYSLLFRIILFSIFRTILYISTERWMPSLHFKFNEIVDIFRYGSNLMGSNILNYTTRNIDNLLVGKYLGTKSLGIYNYAYNLMLLPLSLITNVISEVVFPALSKIKDESVKFKSKYMFINRVVAFITVPFICLVFIVADRLILFILGEKWVDIIPIFRLLCIVAIKQPIGTLTGLIYKSIGITDVQFKWTIFNAVITIISFIIGVQFGLFGIVYAYIARSYLLWYHAITIPGKYIGLSFLEFIRNIQSVFACAIITGIIVYFFAEYVTFMSHFFYLSTVSLVYMLIYLSIIILLKIDIYQETIDFVRKYYLKDNKSIE